MAHVTLAEITEIPDLIELEHMQREVWGPGDLEIIPVSHLKAVMVSGGMILGAYDGPNLLGFAYGFPSFPHEPFTEGFGMHSHMVAVTREARGKGIGQALKKQQKQWCIERGMSWLSWTFDPLQERNARLNLHHLGAVAYEYFPNFYGLLPGELGGDQESDRLLAVWHFGPRHEQYRHRAKAVTEVVPVITPISVPEYLHDLPRTHDFVAVPAVSISVPKNVTALLREHPDIVQEWRAAIRAAFTWYMERGYVAANFTKDGYVLLQATD